MPIIGVRTATQLADNLAALDLRLPADLLASLDPASGLKPGFPSTFLADDDVVRLIFGTMRDLVAN